MNGHSRQTGSRTVEPPRKRKRKNTPSDRARDARTLVNRIESATEERQQAWSEGDQPKLTAYTATELAELHQDKRAMRRAIYAQAPQLEGRPVFRGRPR